MRTNYADSLTVIAAAALVASACGGARPAPRSAPAPTATAPAGAPKSISYTAADVAFVQGMLVHHAQALEMTRLIPDRTNDRDIGRLGRRISESQDYEIGLMNRWLTDRGEEVPALGNGAHGAAGAHAGMAGMATPEQMARLADSKDRAFERLFLELMIRHHEGALTMLEDLAGHDGAGQEPELFVLNSHIDADQRAEIARMRRMLNELQ